MKGNSNDEDGLRKMTSDKGAKMLLPSVMVGRCGNTERQEVKPHFLPKSEQILPHRHPCHFFPGGDSVSSRDGALKDRPWKGHRGAGMRGQWAGRRLQLGVRGPEGEREVATGGCWPWKLSDLGLFICKMAHECILSLFLSSSNIILILDYHKNQLGQHLINEKPLPI